MRERHGDEKRRDWVFDQKQILRVVKRLIQEQGLTYAKLAESLSFSKDVLKKCFSEERISLDRLLEICTILNVDLGTVWELACGEAEETLEFSEDQEEFFTLNPHHFNFFVELYFNGLQPAQIQERHHLSGASLHRYLSDLDRIGILILLPENEIRLRRVYHSMRWREKGPWLRAMITDYVRRLHENSLSTPAALSVGYVGLSSELRDAFFDEIRQLELKYRKLGVVKRFAGEAVEPLSWAMLAVGGEVHMQPSGIPDLR